MNAQPGSIRILVVDDHDAVRRGLRHLLAGYADMEVVGEAEDSVSALRLAASAQPDVILLDVHLPGVNGVEVVRPLRQVCSAARIILLSSFLDAAPWSEALAAGVDGYLLKSDADENLAVAIRGVHRGERGPMLRLGQRKTS